MTIELKNETSWQTINIHIRINYFGTYVSFLIFVTSFFPKA